MQELSGQDWRNDVTLPANSIAILALSAGCIVSGALADRLGPGRVRVAGCVMLGVSSMVLYQEYRLQRNTSRDYMFCAASLWV